MEAIDLNLEESIVLKRDVRQNWKQRRKYKGWKANIVDPGEPAH